MIFKKVNELAKILRRIGGSCRENGFDFFEYL